MAVRRWRVGCKATLQPAAREAFGAGGHRSSLRLPHILRNRYGQSKAPISEHVFANAVDISGFVLGDGRVVKVASGWGATARDAKPVSAKLCAATTQWKTSPAQGRWLERLRLTQARGANRGAPLLRPRHKTRKLKAVQNLRSCASSTAAPASASAPCWDRRPTKATATISIST